MLDASDPPDLRELGGCKGCAVPARWNVDLDRAAPVVVELEQGLVDEPPAVAEVTVVADDRQIHRLPDVSVVHTNLVDHLILELAKLRRVAVAREHDERDVLVEGLCHRGPVVAGRGGRGAGDDDRLARLLSEAEGEIAALRSSTTE